MPELTGLTKYDSTPPVWFVDIGEGGRLELSTEELQSQLKFQRRCMEVLNIMPLPMKAPAWQNMVQELMGKVFVIEAPTDASPKGLLLEYLERFCTGRAQARARDEILLGKPWTEKGKHYFRLLDFMAYLERNRFKEFKTNKICSAFKDIGGDHDLINVKGKSCNVWHVPEFAKQTEGFSIPDIEDKEVF